MFSAKKTLPQQHAHNKKITPTRSRTHLLPTLFDRLCDDAPQRQQETSDEYALTRKQLFDIVQRDLAYLLSTSNMEEMIDRGQHAAAAASTINFGMPSLAGGYLSARKWDDIEELIRRAIHDFEPRLEPDSLQIRPLHKEQSADQYNVLLFEIRGLIPTAPYPIAFLVQSAVDLETNRLTVLSCTQQ